jgi:hypothetical protein
MTERRSMGTAFALTPEKVAFIAGSETPALAGQNAEQRQVASAVPPHSRKPQNERAVGRRTSTEPEAESLLGVILVPLTTRLQPRTADALRRACLQQRLRGKAPHTQQQIVEIAIDAWLKSNGYLEAR